jgi:hypothetical protein
MEASLSAEQWGITALDLNWACTPGDIDKLQGWHGWGEATRHVRASGRGVHFYKF